MNKLLLTSALVLCFANCFGQFTDDLAIGSVLKGNVDSVVLTLSVINKYEGKKDTLHVFARYKYEYNSRMQLMASYGWSYIDIPRTAYAGAKPVIIKYTYDFFGNLIAAQNSYDQKPRFKSTYLKKGLFVEVRGYDCIHDTLTNVDTLKINAAGKIIERTNHTYSGTSIIRHDYFKYNSNGQLIERGANYSDGSSKVSAYYKYNSEGDLIEDNDGTFPNEVNTYSYQEYDRVGNWLVKTKYSAGREVYAYTRRIYYHK